MGRALASAVTRGVVEVMTTHLRTVLFPGTLLMALLAAPEPRSEAAEKTGPRIVAYFVEWGVYQRNYHVSDIPADRLTHLHYAFAQIQKGECALHDRFAALEKSYPGDRFDEPGRGNFKQLQLLKKKHPHLKVLIALGGWSLSSPFSDAALTAESRTKLARSCVAFMKQYGFDGVDIDWEYPVGGGLAGNNNRPEDRTNFTLLLAELRRQLDEQGKADGQHYLLAIAAPAGPKTYAHLELDKIHAYLDYIDLMTYDFHGGWEAVTGFHAPLYPAKDDPTKDETIRTRFNVDAAVRAYLGAGVPAEKLLLGVPFYGRGWGGVKDGNRGLYQPANPQPPRGTWENGVWDYRDLAANYLGKFPRHWHDEARTPWLFDPRTGVMISYDDPQSLKLKAEYARDRKLGGVFFWELSGDDRQSSLLSALHEGLRAPKK
jgi:chitinase